MRRYVADTHGLIWHLTKSPRLSPTALAVFREADAGTAIVYVSAMSLLELTLLGEKGGPVPPTLVAEMFQRLSSTAIGSYEMVPVDESIVVAFQSIPKGVIRDVFDRCIAATALALNAPLLTCDHEIVNAGVVSTIW